MNPLNIFKNNNEDFINLQKIRNEIILLNGEPIHAIVTRPEFARTNSIYISTTTPLHSGDIVEYLGKQFMIISQPKVARYESYKAKAELVEFRVFFNLETTDFPRQKNILYVPVLVKLVSDKMNYSSSFSLYTTDSTINLTLPKNPYTNYIFKMLSKPIFVGKAKWEITSILEVEEGLIHISASSTTINSNEDNLSIGISGSGYVPSKEQVDERLLDIFGYKHYPVGDILPPEIDEEEGNDIQSSTTEVTLNSFDSSNYILDWNKELKADTYDGFEGYHLRIVNESGVVAYEVDVLDISPTVTYTLDTTNFQDGLITVYISSQYKQGGETFKMKEQELVSFDYSGWGWG